MSILKIQAEAALAEVEKLTREARSIDSDASLTAGERRSRIEPLNARIQAKLDEARGATEQLEREAETRGLGSGLGGALVPREPRFDSSEDWGGSLVPSSSELRAATLVEGVDADGGYAVPKKVSESYVGLLRAKSVFLSAPGLRIVPFSGTNQFSIPKVASWTNPGVVAEAATIPSANGTLTALTFKALKFSQIQKASRELLDDTDLPMRQLVSEQITEGLAQAVDVQAFANGDGVTALKGLTAAGMSTNTALATGNTQISYRHLADAYAAVVAAGATPTVVWVSADQFAGLMTERENGTTGAFMAGSVTDAPAQSVWGLPLRVSANLPVKTAVVADASSIYVGVRQEPTVDVNENAYWDSDVVGIKVGYRVGGLAVANPTAVQRITASAT